MNDQKEKQMEVANMVGQIILVKAGNSAEFAAAGRGLKAVAPLLRRIEKAHDTPTLFRFYRAMDAYEKLEKTKAGKAVLPQAKEAMRDAFEGRLPILEKKTTKASIGVSLASYILGAGIFLVGLETLTAPLVLMATSIFLGGAIGNRAVYRAITKAIGDFKEKILGPKSADAPKAGGGADLFSEREVAVIAAKYFTQ